MNIPDPAERRAKKPFHAFRIRGRCKGRNIRKNLSFPAKAEAQLLTQIRQMGPIWNGKFCNDPASGRVQRQLLWDERTIERMPLISRRRVYTARKTGV